MSKIKIKTILKTSEDNIINECKGVKINNKIKFIDNDINTIIEIEKDNIFLTRTTEEYEMKLQFKKFLTIAGFYDIKNIGMLDLKVNTEELIIEDNKIYIEYILYVNNENLNKSTYELEYEVIE